MSVEAGVGTDIADHQVLAEIDEKIQTFDAMYRDKMALFNSLEAGTKKDLERNVWLGQVKGFEVTLSPSNTFVKDEQQQKEGFINPFWMVTSVENADEANMNVKWESLVGVGLYAQI